MNSEFKVGDLVVLQNATTFEEYNGFPAIVLRSGRTKRVMNMATMQYVWIYCYRVKILTESPEILVGKLKIFAAPWQMRKLHGSDDEAFVSVVSSAVSSES